MIEVHIDDTQLPVTISIGYYQDWLAMSPDEALDLAARLLTAANVANGYTTTGVFA